MIYDKEDHQDEEGRQEALYHKYLAFHDVLLEDYDPMEIAAIMVVQGLSIYRTILSEKDYQKLINKHSRKEKKEGSLFV